MEPLKKPRRRNTLRLRNYDYSAPGAYFVTVCTNNRECLFGNIQDDKMVLNDVGHMTSESWLWLSQQYDHIDLDTWVIMPIICMELLYCTMVGAVRAPPQQEIKNRWVD